MRSVFLFLSICFFSHSVFAGMLLDLGVAYSADSLSKPTESGNTQTFYNANLLFNLDNRGSWNAGWIFYGISQTSTAASVASTYTSFDMGPAIRWNMDKNRMFSFTLAYGYLAKGGYSSGSTTEAWEGTSLLGQFSIQMPIRDEKLSVGLSLNYYAANYSKKVVSSVESTTDAQKTWMFPMISMTWRP